MELFPKLFTVIGLCIDIAGVILLAYDLFWGPGNKWQLEVLNTQLKNEVLLHKSILADYNRLRQNIGNRMPASYISEENDRHNIAVHQLEESIKTLKSEYPHRVHSWGIRGLALVVLGFAFQVLGALLSRC